MKPKIYKNNIEINCSDINQGNISKLSLIFDLSPQDKAESCIDYIRYHNDEIIVFDYDGDHSQRYKKGTKKYQEYIDLLAQLGYNDIKDDIANFDSIQKGEQKQFLSKMKR